MMVFSPLFTLREEGYLVESICDSSLGIALIIFFMMEAKVLDFRIVLIVLTFVYFLFDVYRCLETEKYLNLNYVATFIFFAFLFKRLLLEK